MEHKNTSNGFAPHLALVCCNLLWAVDYPLYHILLPHYMSPIVLLTAALVSTTIFASIAAARSGLERVKGRDMLVLVGAALLLGVIHKGSLMLGLSRTSPVDGSIINTAGPLIVLIFSVLMRLDKLTPTKIIGLAIGLAGAVAVILTGDHSSHAKSTIEGNLLIVCAVAATALYTVFLKCTLEKYKVTTVLFWVYLLSSIMVLPWGINETVHSDFSNWDHKATLSFVIIMCALTYLPNFLYNFALQHIKPFQTSIFSYIQPVAAIALSVVLGLDKVQPETYLFAAGVFAGIGIVLWSYRKDARKAADNVVKRE